MYNIVYHYQYLEPKGNPLYLNAETIDYKNMITDEKPESNIKTRLGIKNIISIILINK